MLDMRVLLFIAVLSSSAIADSAAPKDQVPSAAEGTARVHGDRPAGAAAGVIVPPAIPDAQPYPRGMVIAPPYTGDWMLNPAISPWLLLTRSLWHGLGEAFAQLHGAALPPVF